MINGSFPLDNQDVVLALENSENYLKRTTREMWSAEFTRKEQGCCQINRLRKEEDDKKGRIRADSLT
ncbi:hypothetical protein Csa_003520 [Cucumis sativus]|uniref:Uncharacterized protein n=1 Tax=Cucumis sativus TaxID=3659 RepID=A0A0A0KM13_CUCSA|nr:hypothetical protein Csa_003520 [Cucumis sativus]